MFRPVSANLRKVTAQRLYSPMPASSACPWRSTSRPSSRWRRCSPPSHKVPSALPAERGMCPWRCVCGEYAWHLSFQLYARNIQSPHMIICYQLSMMYGMSLLFTSASITHMHHRRSTWLALTMRRPVSRLCANALSSQPWTGHAGHPSQVRGVLS